MFDLKQGRSRIALILLVLLISVWSLGQTSKGTIAGTVLDESNAVVVNATVQVTPVNAPDIPRSTTTGSHGEYRVEALNPGTYTVTIAAPNFATYKVENLDVKGSALTTFNAELKIAKVSETVTVEGSAQQLKTETSEVSHSIGQQEINNLPLGNLNPIAIALTEPGVTSTSGQPGGMSNGQNFSANGLRPRENNFLVDGTDNNDNSIQGQALQQTNLEAVQEVVVKTNSYEAEFGRGGASVTNVIQKGGSNAFHGSAWDRYAGSGLDALSPGQTDGRLEKGRYDEHTFGFAFGGPAIKDKIFFFGTAQWDRTLGNTSFGAYRRVPDENGQAALAGISGAVPRAGDLLNVFTYGSPNYLFYPGSTYVRRVNIGQRAGCPVASQSTAAATLGDCLIETNYALLNVPQYNRNMTWQWKADWNATPNDTLSFQFLKGQGTYSPDFFNSPYNNVPSEFPMQGGPNHQARMVWTHILNPTTINEFRAAWNHFDYTFGLMPSYFAGPLGDPTSYLYHYTTISDTSSVVFGASTNMPQGRGHHSYQVQDAFSKSFGSHSVKFGADVNRILVRDGVPFLSRGSYNYSTGGDCSALNMQLGVATPLTCSAMSNFLDNFSGTSASLSLQFGSPWYRDKGWQDGFYLQDTWKVKPNLTFNLGVRWEYQPNPANSMQYPAINPANEPSDWPGADPVTHTGGIPAIIKVKEDLNNWGPRVGFAYTPRFWKGLFGDNATVIHAGYGLFYDVLFTNLTDNVQASAPNTVGGTFFGAGAGRGSANWSGQFVNISPTLKQTNSVSGLPSDLVNPIVHQWSFGFQRELPWRTMLAVDYVGTRGQRLFINDDLNSGVGYTGGVLGTLIRMDTHRGAITMRDNHGDSIYHGLQTKFEHRVGRGLFLRASYTWSRALDNGSENWTTTGGSSYPQNTFLQHAGDRTERGPGAFNHTHRLALAYTYDVPNVPKLDNKALDMMAFVVRGWGFAGTTTFQTGMPDTVYLGYDNNFDGFSGNDRPNLANASAPINTWAFPCGSYWTVGYGVACAPGQWFNGLTFAQNDAPTFDLVDPTTVHWNAPMPGVNGNVGRNTFYNPGRQDWNFSVTRHFRMPYKEGHEFMFRMEMFNPFNHANVTELNWNLSSSVYNDRVSRLSGSRSIVFWAKYSF